MDLKDYKIKPKRMYEPQSIKDIYDHQYSHKNKVKPLAFSYAKDCKDCSALFSQFLMSKVSETDVLIGCDECQWKLSNDIKLVVSGDVAEAQFEHALNNMSLHSTMNYGGNFIFPTSPILIAPSGWPISDDVRDAIRESKPRKKVLRDGPINVQLEQQ